MNPDIWLTADTHFGHANIIKYCNRPFSSVEEHDEKLIENWNSVIKEKDIVYLIGDFAFKGKTPDYYTKRLRGKIVLIKGNHDHFSENTYRALFYDYKPSGLYELKHNKIRYILCHYPMLSWNGSFHGSLHFFGHIHSGPLNQTNGYSISKNSFDVGVDNNNFTPISLENACEKARTLLC